MSDDADRSHQDRSAKESIPIGGWFRVYRRITDSEVWRNENLLKLWVLVMAMASRNERTVPQADSAEAVHLLPGQFTIGREQLHARYYGSRKPLPAGAKDARTVWRWLQRLEEMGNVRIDSTRSKFSIVSVVNWQNYQGEAPTPRKQKMSKAKRRSNGVSARTCGDGVLENVQSSDDALDMSKGKLHLSSTTEPTSVWTDFENVHHPRIHGSLESSLSSIRRSRTKVFVDQIEDLAGRIFHQAGYQGSDGKNFWKVAGMWRLGWLSEADVIDACQAAKLKAEDPPRYFYTTLRNRLQSQDPPKDLDVMRRSIRVVPHLPTGPPAKPATQLESVAHLASQLSAD